LKQKLKYMKYFLPLITFLFVFLSCQKDESDVSNRPLLHEKFNGKYELISSGSKTAVDLNNDGIKSMNLLDENSMILFSFIEIRIPTEPELFLKDNEFLFSEFWPTENDTRFTNKEVIAVYKTRVWGYNYDLYCQTFIGRFEEDLRTCTLRTTINDDGKNTLIEIKSIEIVENETIKVTVVRKLYTMNGWVESEIESLYKRYTIIT
jgi:hypothetical protein